MANFNITLKKINWSISGSIDYNQYDKNEYFLTPNNINEIISGYNESIDAINTCQTIAVSCQNEFTLLSANLTNKATNVENSFNIHKNNLDIDCQHITQAERQKWNTMAGQSYVTSINVGPKKLTGEVKLSISDDLNGVIVDDFEKHYTNATEYKHPLQADIDYWNQKVDPSAYVRSIKFNDGPELTGVVAITDDTFKIIKTINDLTGDIILSSATSNIKIETSSKNNTINFTCNEVLPIGTFMWWFGTAASIPAGWTICDGRNIATEPALNSLRSIIGDVLPELTTGSYIEGSTYPTYKPELAEAPNIWGDVGMITEEKGRKFFNRCF